ncbi:putative pyruvate, phosphate dikinase regulatory protein [Caldovatus sediminis]|uniref:Putative pyruvate, phosphate dikinase regulatory protein n=1 Tax=Caldovatus sediminis TaxID=2041189 RepID=A0A8J2ZAK5_9PROT|nr:putative pyruvate, phosphate dikinase regulatory protein [Caldovatus sediminis]
MTTTGRSINLHLVSDSTGETLNSIARATITRFEDAHVIVHRWSLIRSRLQLDRVLEGIQHDPGPVLFTLVDRSLRHALEETCARLGLPCMSVLDPVMDLLQGAIGRRAKEKRAAQHVLDADYFRRIDAMHFVLSHDDGQGLAGIAEADVVLVGVSRSSKTPTCFYLANRGIKAANVPIVPGAPLPPELENPPCPVIGLTIETNALIEIRRHRLRLIGAGGVRQDTNAYIDPDAVKAEILAARRLCTQRGWPVIDVTRRSIEETAATVLQLMEAWHARRGRAAEPVLAHAPADPAAPVLGRVGKAEPAP